MKRFRFFLPILLSLTLIACAEKAPKEKGMLTLAEESFALPEEGGSVTLHLTTNTDYSISIGAPWVSRSNTKATREESVSFEVQPNPGKERNCRIDFLLDGAVTASVLISQDAKLILPDNFSYKLADGDAFNYNPALHRISVFTSGEDNWLRFLSLEDFSVVELGPLPTEFQVKESYDFSLNRYQNGSLVGEPRSQEKYTATKRAFSR